MDRLKWMLSAEREAGEQNRPSTSTYTSRVYMEEDR
jgi:hypothetical protein